MKAPSNFNELYRQLMLRKVPFLMVFFGTIFITYLFLFIVDFIPEAPAADDEVHVEENESATGTSTIGTFEVLPKAAPEPERVIIDKLEREVAVLNPTSRDIADLDAALLSGVVRHPDSADFSEDGNILILGHSSYLPNVLNKNFQAFNGLHTLTWGDKIRLQSEDTEYVYRVEKVYEAKAAEVVIPETPGEARLTLATCNSFGAKDDRFIVEAVLVSETAL